jgi:DNA-binding MurR/RpiR family transcriptional regulator
MLRERVTSQRKNMTPGQALVANYILEYPREAAFLTASQLGKRVGVSETTVLRLAHLLGFSGYQEMRSTMANLLMNHLSTLERLKDYESAQEYDFFERAIRKDLKTLTLALSNISSKDLNRLGEAMAKADAVYLAGYRSSFSLTYYLSFYLSWILPNVKNVSLDMPFEMLANAPSGSIVLYVLSVPYKPVSFIDSFAAPMSVLNCLILSVAQHLGENVTEKLGMLERRWREDEVYTNQKEL